jgi:hypothetical protein
MRERFPNQGGMQASLREADGWRKIEGSMPEQLTKGTTTMRVLVIATVLLMSSALTPSFAQEQQKSPAPNQPPMTAVQPERSPQQSEQSREQDRRSAEDVQVGRDWRTQQRDGDRMGRQRRMNDQNDFDHRTVGRNWQMQRDDERGYYDEDRPRSRVKICTVYENGDEFCRYRN